MAFGCCRTRDLFQDTAVVLLRSDRG